MHYKAAVLKRVPHARPVVVTTHDDGTPRYVSIWVGKRELDLYNSDWQQRHGAAWRSAFYALRRMKSGLDAMGPLYRQRGKGTQQ